MDAVFDDNNTDRQTDRQTSNILRVTPICSLRVSCTDRLCSGANAVCLSVCMYVCVSVCVCEIAVVRCAVMIDDRCVVGSRPLHATNLLKTMIIDAYIRACVRVCACGDSAGRGAVRRSVELSRTQCH